MEKNHVSIKARISDLEKIKSTLLTLDIKKEYENLLEIHSKTSTSFKKPPYNNDIHNAIENFNYWLKNQMMVSLTGIINYVEKNLDCKNKEVGKKSCSDIKNKLGFIIDYANDIITIAKFEPKIRYLLDSHLLLKEIASIQEQYQLTQNRHEYVQKKEEEYNQIISYGVNIDLYLDFLKDRVFDFIKQSLILEEGNKLDELISDFLSPIEAIGLSIKTLDSVDKIEGIKW